MIHQKGLHQEQKNKIVECLTRMKEDIETDDDILYLKQFDVKEISEYIKILSESDSKNTPTTSWNPNHGKKNYSNGN